MTWEEFIERRGYCAMHQKSDIEEFPKCTLGGYYIGSDLDILQVEVTIRTDDGELVYTEKFIPYSTQSQWSTYGYEMGEAVEAQKAIDALSPGKYVIDVTVYLDAETSPVRDLWTCIFSIE